VPRFELAGKGKGRATAHHVLFHSTSFNISINFTLHTNLHNASAVVRLDDTRGAAWPLAMICWVGDHVDRSIVSAILSCAVLVVRSLTMYDATGVKGADERDGIDWDGG